MIFPFIAAKSTCFPASGAEVIAKHLEGKKLEVSELCFLFFPSDWCFLMENRAESWMIFWDLPPHFNILEVLACVGSSLGCNGIFQVGNASNSRICFPNELCPQTGMDTPRFRKPPNDKWLVVYLPLWKIYESQLGWLFPISGKIKHVPNHQPDRYIYIYVLSTYKLPNHQADTCSTCFHPVQRRQVVKVPLARGARSWRPSERWDDPPGPWT